MVFIVVLTSMLYFINGFMLPSYRIWHEGRDVSDILGFCGARGVTVGTRAGYRFLENKI
jgi:hypothetical protein